jgi:hypothetical protein
MDFIILNWFEPVALLLRSHDIQHKATQHNDLNYGTQQDIFYSYAEGKIFTVMLRVVMMSVDTQSTVMLSIDI